MGRGSRPEFRAAVLMGRRNTGFPQEVKELILARAAGMCEVMRPGCVMRGSEIHHRMTSGMGSAKVSGINEASNGLLLCHACHRWITEHPKSSYERGWAVRRNAVLLSPADVEVWWRSSKWLLLDDDGGFEVVSSTKPAAVFPLSRKVSA